MTLKFKTTGTGKVFYGWIALAGSMLTVFASGGAMVHSYGVFLPVICNEFGWSRAQVALGLSLGVLSFGLPSPLWGILVARFGPRINLVLGNLLAALGLAGMSLIQEVWHVYLCYSIVGLGAGLGGYIAGTTVANNWFIRKRSLAMGLFGAAAGLGGFVFPMLTTVLISSFGWRMAWLVLAGILFIGADLIGGVILVRNRPEDMGQLPDGIATEYSLEVEAMGNLPGAGGRQEEWHVKQALREPTIWLVSAFASANFYVMHTIIAHQVAYMRGLGFSPMVAAMTLSVASAFIIIAGLVFGTLALRYNIRYLVSAGFGIQLIALSILLTSKNLTWLYIYAALLGFSSGAIFTAWPTFIGAYYGRAHYAQIMGVIFPINVISQASSPAIAGVIYDAADTYIPAFAILAAFSLAGLICAFLARQPKPPQSNV